MGSEMCIRDRVIVVGFFRFLLRCSPQHNRAFPLGGVLLKVQQGTLHRLPHLFFVAFGEFPCHLQGTVSSAVVVKFLEQCDQAVRRFV